MQVDKVIMKTAYQNSPDFFIYRRVNSQLNFFELRCPTYACCTQLLKCDFRKRFCLSCYNLC